MTINQIAVRPDPTLPDQFFEITISTQFPLLGACKAMIERPGQEEAYLASSGWQANYTHIEVALRQDHTPLQGLRLSRNLLRFFEPGYNYKISLFDMQGAELGFFVIGWNPGQDLLTPRRPADLPIATEPMPELEPIPQTVPLPPEFKAVQVQPRVFVSPREVIQCRKCGGEIFSTFATCPYCRSSLGH